MGIASVPHLSPQKSIEVASTGIQSIANVRSVAPQLINASRNEMTTSSIKPFNLNESQSIRLSTKKPNYESISNVLSNNSIK